MRPIAEMRMLTEQKPIGIRFWDSEHGSIQVAIQASEDYTLVSQV